MHVLSSWSDSSHFSTRIAFSDCCLQSSQSWRWRQNFCFGIFLENSRMAITMVFQQHDVTFIIYLWLLHSQGGPDSLHKLIISVFLQQLCAYEWSCDLPSNPFICLSSRPSPCTKLSLLAEFFPWNFDWESSDLHLLCRCWFIIPKSYLDFSHPKPHQVTAWASPSNVICWYSSFLLKLTTLHHSISLHYTMCIMTMP
jgi:hypothetical protein